MSLGRAAIAQVLEPGKCGQEHSVSQSCHSVINMMSPVINTISPVIKYDQEEVTAPKVTEPQFLSHL